MSQAPHPAGAAANSPAAFTNALPSYLDPSNLGPWGGLVAPFIGIKLIDMFLAFLRLA